ncbi:UNVERIFIED_CONTAM: hypothetical protein Cloal_3804 [Acetivibrio alkalicellulosi]
MSFKKRGIILVVIALFTVVSIVAIGSNGKYKEPAKRPDLPESARFNPYTNEYYCSEILTWNTEKMDYDYIGFGEIDNSDHSEIDLYSERRKEIIMYIESTLEKDADGKYTKPEQDKTYYASLGFKWNSYDGSYYHPHDYEWDQEFEEYIDVDSASDYKNKKPEHKSIKHFVKAYSGSDDEVKLALISYAQDYSDYYEENYQRIMLSSSWNVGPLDAIKNLGLEKLPELLTYVEEENVFCVPVMIAICEIFGGEQFANISPCNEGITVWKDALKAKISSNEVNELVKEVRNNKGSSIFRRRTDRRIEEEFSKLGAFALPVVYDEVINKSNDDLIEYAMFVLPKKTIEKHGLDNNSRKEKVKAALESCSEAVKVLSSLK